MVVCLILKIHQPLFCRTVNLHRNHDAACIDFIRNFHVLKLSLAPQLLHSHKSQVHKAHVLIVPSLINHFPVSQVLLIGFLHGLSVIAVRKAYIFKLCGKGSMAAVIRPISIQHTDLRHRRIPVLFLLIIILDMKEVLKGHGQVQGAVKSLQLLL